MRGDVPGGEPLDRPIGYEWAGDPERVATVTVALVDGIDEALEIANAETSGLAAGIVTEDAAAADASWPVTGARPPSGTRRPASRMGSSSPARPRPGSTSTAFPGPRGPVTYRDLWLRQYRVIGDGRQTR